MDMDDSVELIELFSDVATSREGNSEINGVGGRSSKLLARRFRVWG